MCPLHRPQSFSRSLFWHGFSSWTAVPSGKSAPALACDPLWSAGKIPAPAPEATPPSPSSLTLVLRGLFHLLPHSSLPCSILPVHTDTSTEVPPASLTCSAVSRGGSAAELPGTSCVWHRATHTRAPELNTKAQTKSWTLRTSWPSPVLSFLCPKSYLWGHSGADPQTDLDSQQ